MRGLRDYGLEPLVWGGKEGCAHEWRTQVKPAGNGMVYSEMQDRRDGGSLNAMSATRKPSYSDFCDRCCAWRGALGLEPTPDLYVQHLVEIFREVRRVLRDDGTVWLNLGDCYATGAGLVGRDPGGGAPGARWRGEITRLRDEKRGSRGQHLAEHSGKSATRITAMGPNRMPLPGLKPKDLVGIPWLVARALQEPYYAGRMKEAGDRRWLAAMIDGEGTICGFHHIRSDDGRPRTGVHIFITNGSTDLLDEAHRIWPASRSEHQRPGAGHLGQIQTWRWIVHGIENKTLFLREVYPHLIAKRRQAIVAYNLLLLMAVAKRLGHSPQRDATREKRKLLTDLLSALNQGRSADLPSWVEEPPPCYELGWWLRSDIIWSKPNSMPESVTDRPTKSHEYLFLLTKSKRYYYDAEAIKEWARSLEEHLKRKELYSAHGDGETSRGRGSGHNVLGPIARLKIPSGWDGDPGVHRNKRTVWEIPTEAFPGAHFATFPQDLVTPCILAGTSERGACARCGAPWTRQIETQYHNDTTTDGRPATGNNRKALERGGAETGARAFASGVRTRRLDTTLGWSPTCRCGVEETVPCIVLDPFVGSGTAVLVAKELGRIGVGVELKPEYLRMARKRTTQGQLV